MVEAQDLNPIDFSCQMAARLQGECLLFLAPLLVDSAETKRRLIGPCGLDQLISMAGRLDLAVVSCGEVAAGGSSPSRGFVSDADFTDLAAAGAACDCMCHFLDSGRGPPHRPGKRRRAPGGGDRRSRAANPLPDPHHRRDRRDRNRRTRHPQDARRLTRHLQRQTRRILPGQASPARRQARRRSRASGERTG